MRLPAGHYLEIAARSSTFRKKRLILTNGIGIIDEDYCGADDETFDGDAFFSSTSFRYCKLSQLLPPLAYKVGILVVAQAVQTDQHVFLPLPSSKNLLFLPF